MFSVHKSNLSTLRYVNQNLWTLGSDIYSLNRVKFRGRGQLWRHINLPKYILVWKFLLKCNHVHVGKIWILSTYANEWHTSHFLASLFKNKPNLFYHRNFRDTRLSYKKIFENYQWKVYIEKLFEIKFRCNTVDFMDKYLING